MAAPNDTRILTENELEEYAKDYHMLEDLSHYDFSNLDFDSDYFRSLPPAEQYSILNSARLRSRLRMGYSKEQLDDMFPDRLAFSRFQIQRLKERNDYTQRLMNLNGMNDVGPQRIAGEKGREYFLVRNEGVEGGWVLGTAVAKNDGAKENPVLLDMEQRSVDDEDLDGEFEDVPLEVSQEEPEMLKAISQPRREARIGYGVQTKIPFKPVLKPTEALFVDDDEESENVDTEEDPELQHAIKLSIEQSASQGDVTDVGYEEGMSLPDMDERRIDHAIAMSLAEKQPRPLTSSSTDSELQRALAQSRDDFIRPSAMEVSDGPEDVIIVESPSKDKGKGKEISPPESSLSENEDIQRAIEMSKSEIAYISRPNGIGTSRDAAIDLRSEGGLGRSMFRKKPQPATTIEKKVDEAIRQMPSERTITLEIAREPAMDKVLEEKVREASPVDVPMVHSIQELASVPPELPSPKDRSSSSLSPQPPITTEDDLIGRSPQVISPSPEHAAPSHPDEPSSQPNLDAIPSSQEEQLYLSDDEDEELMAQLAAEEEEHARFATQLNPNARKSDLYSALQEPLDEESFEKEMRSLRNQQKKDRRDADEVNQLMVIECQQLLRLFGLPYITAPMEAEAQCAELVRLGLVDGIVTDDSDIFLFGGTRVYKNMFNQGKFVECYLLSDLERDFNLDRQKFINLAHLLGSDYADGIPHVGPVNALELLSEFPGEQGLEEFRDWWIAVQQGRAPKSSGESEFRRKFRKNSTKIFLPTDFPNRVVDNAYLHPDVDQDPQPFLWGIPDLDALRSFLMSQIGWTKERTDEILVPVIKDMNRRQVFPNYVSCTYVRSREVRPT